MLTANQEKALDYTRNLSVIANAGAGKTTVLIKRYLKILSTTDTQVKEIAAITFTEKAASELKKKIADQVKNALLDKSEEKVHRRWAVIRDQLTSANIGTIHSFCAQLLREYPVESDVDASFSVLNNFDQFAFEEEAIRGAITGMLTDANNPERRKSILTLLRSVDRWGAEQYCRIFLRKREQVDRVSGMYNFSSPAEVAEKTHMALVRYVSEYLSHSHWEEFLGKILEHSDKFRQLQSELQKWHTLRDEREKVEFFYRITDAVFTQKHELIAKLQDSLTEPSSVESDINRLKLIHAYASAMDGCRDENKEDRGNMALFETLGPMFYFYRETLRRYEEKKGEYGYLDFEDILLKTRSLLQNTEIARAVSAKFKYILVDEFQDTNSLQYDIIHSLALADHPLNLFIVGDAKQSIYGFRHAEVEVFERADSEISRTNLGQSIVLEESFRLLPNIIDFVNRVFSRLMEPDITDFRITYNELVQGRPNKTDGVVELLLVPQSEKGEPGGVEKNDAIAAECRMVAERIINLVREGPVIYRGRHEDPGSFEFRDAAILLRARTHLRTLEKTLREYSIPYILSGGIGYFQTQEVLDVVNYLKFLLNPDDDIALAGILRSPFFAVSDAEIYSIALTGNASLWKKLDACGHQSPSRRRLDDVLAILHNHLDIAKRLSIPTLIQRIIVDTGWIGIMAGLPTGEQNIANIDKLLRIAREFEQRGYPSLYDFVQRLVRHTEDEQREGQAPQDVQGNCVRVMTIHSAKGLEFGVVFLPFLHKNFQRDKAPFIDSDYGIAFPVRDNENAEEKLEPALMKFLKSRQTRRVQAEEKRILYVACTRARDMLILSGQNKSKNDTSFLKWIIESLGIGDRIGSPGILHLDAAPLKVLDRPKNSIVETLHPLTISLKGQLKDGQRIDWSREPKSRESESKEYQLAQVKGSISGEFYSATQIATYLECPRKFYLKYHLGVPEFSPRPYHFYEDEESNDMLKGDVEGTLTHSVLQSIRRVDLSEQEVTEEIHRAMMKSLSALWDQREEYEESIKRMIIGFLRSPIGKQIFESTESKSEFKINLALGNYFFTGTMDRLFKDRKGLWNIVDYKTNRIEIDEIEKLAMKYLPQMKFYAALVKRYFGQAQVPVILIFLRHPAKPFSFILDENQIIEFENTLCEISQKIAQKRFDENSFHCTECGYQKAGQCIM